MNTPHEGVAFLGPRASYTHQAALKAFSDSSKYDLQPQVSIEDVFKSVQSGSCARGVVPFENSTNGSVVFTLDLFADAHQRYPDILVCGEVYVDVHHCLVGHMPKEAHSAATTSALTSPHSSGHATPTAAHPSPAIPRAVPLVSLKGIKKLYSHPQAWGQCNAFLTTYFKGIERQDVSSTSRAAEIVAADTSGETAAISSEIAAQVHDLDMLAKGIEDTSDNKTRFFVLRRGNHSAQSNGDSNGGAVDTDTPAYKTLVSFTISHSDPGALADSLAVFKPYNINLTSINARPSGIASWNYIFFVEVTGRRLKEDTGAVNAALRDLEKVAREWRWLGSWENMLLPKCRPLGKIDEVS
ncbi:PDT-domain-containing protein [Pseudovirgaria hyperparasitica]|uniref:prephenate dehydratase n=1 Tax=Pseudovirgaria hyperparasitica TaxID=470096 RepID=A0A6A6W163_9PEZI|nr:PDT-domain-containing protein [Pseudovirgaria hyperparasitica]KAF2755869.1 PDT-domain-containing protein [Pseudovirgaria hyperparasitica]